MITEKEKRIFAKKVKDSEEEMILEELSQQISRKDKLRTELDMSLEDIDKRVKKIIKNRIIPKTTLNELEPKERAIAKAILSLLDELTFLSTEENTDYLVDCWLDIKAKYYRLTEDAKKVVKPQIKKTIKPLGKQFKI